MSNSPHSLSNYRTCALVQGTYTKAQGSTYFSGGAEWPAAENCGCTGQLPLASLKMLVFTGQERPTVFKATFVRK